MGLYRSNFFALPVDIITEILLDTTHRYHCVVAQGLNDLEWGEKTVLVDSL